MRLGIGSYTYTWSVGVPGQLPASPMDPEAIIDAARSLGVSVVQLCDNIPLHELDAGDLARIADHARDAGVTLEAGTRGTDPAHLRKMIGVAASLGARLLRSMITGSLADAERDIRQVLSALAQEGITLALENYERHPVKGLAELIRRVGSPSVGACLDTVNSLGALETPAEAVEALLPLTVNLHLKDFDIVRADHRMGFSVIGTPAGKGRLDVESLIRATRVNGRDPNAILELWTPPAGRVEETVAREKAWAMESISLLRRYIEQ
jgi:sugar phosphate isomerase/epimerase